MSTRRFVRHSTEFKIRLVQSYLAGEGTIKGIARQHGIYHNLFRLWVEEYETQIAALERKVGQLTMEIDILKKLRERTSQSEETPSVISGPAVSPSSKGAGS
jgi:transposase-like protein